MDGWKTQTTEGCWSAFHPDPRLFWPVLRVVDLSLTSPRGKDQVKGVWKPIGIWPEMFMHVLIFFITMHPYYGGCIDNPWDKIAIRYVIVTSYIARKHSGEASNEQSQLISCVYLPLDFRTTYEDRFSGFLTQNTGWTMPSLFSMLHDLRDLAFDVSCLICWHSCFDMSHRFRPLPHKG